MSQTYPIGRDNLNQLMQLQLGTEAFDVIHKVASNLEDLKKISEALPMIQSMNEKLQELETQVQSIQTSLNEKLQELETQMQSTQTSLDKKLKGLETQMQSTQTSLDEKLKGLETQVQSIHTSPVIQSMNEKLQEVETQVQSIHTRLDEIVLRLNTIQQSP